MALLLAGCASFGPAEEADARKLTWFSYVNGEDLRAQCSKEEPDRYRLIYNSKSNAQLRTYEVRAAGDAAEGAGGAVVEARIIPTESAVGGAIRKMLWRLLGEEGEHAALFVARSVRAVNHEAC